MSTQTDGAPVSAGVRIGRIAQNAAALLRLRLLEARAGMRASLRGLAVGAAMAAAAAALALLALPLLVTTAILILAMYVPPWAAVGLVLVATVLAAGLLLLAARRRLRWAAPPLLRDLRSDWEAIRGQLLEERR
jgi:protein-S-isoprenylcysteine O-methyltransferase Ste14